jgi:hypothetical protein
VRDRAILSTLLFHALRREELCKLKVRDFRNTRRGVPHLTVDGKGVVLAVRNNDGQIDALINAMQVFAQSADAMAAAAATPSAKKS